MIRYLLVMAMIILTPPKGNGGMPLAPKPAVIEARVWDKLAAALSFVESRAMLLFDLLEKKILTPDGLNLKEVDRRKEYENEFE